MFLLFFNTGYEFFFQLFMVEALLDLYFTHSSLKFDENIWKFLNFPYNFKVTDTQM